MVFVKVNSMFRIIEKRKVWFSISSLLVAVSIVVLVTWGLKLGIDFTGGSLLEVEYSAERPTPLEITNVLSENGIEHSSAQPYGQNGVLIRMRNLTQDEHIAALGALRAVAPLPKGAGTDSGMVFEGIDKDGNTISVPANVISPKDREAAVTELRFESIGPTIGQELRRQAVWAILAVLLAIIAYIAYAFRKVSKPVASWKFGLSAIVALTHDILIVMGLFAVLGHFLGLEVGSLFVTALLTILGFSVHDTIVTFDRVRENLMHDSDEFSDTVNKSVNQTIVRSLNTSGTTLLVLAASYLFGGESIQDFILALGVGVVIGTYSSIFLASPVLVLWKDLADKKSA